jgi:hypothetical protein
LPVRKLLMGLGVSRHGQPPAKKEIITGTNWHPILTPRRYKRRLIWILLITFCDR